MIMVGEMRDHETVVHGHRGLSYRAPGFQHPSHQQRPETITRLLDMGMDPFNFADALLGVLAQRLVRTLCKSCKEPYHPSREEYDALVRSYDGNFDALGFPYTEDLVLYKAKGCEMRNTGYKGRTAIVELLEGTDEDESADSGQRPGCERIREQAAKDGYDHPHAGRHPEGVPWDHGHPAGPEGVHQVKRHILLVTCTSTKPASKNSRVNPATVSGS